MIMADIVLVIINSRWSGIHIIVFFLWKYAFLPEGNALVAEAAIEKGFIPSLPWFEGTSNVTVVQQEAQHQGQKETIHAAYQNHYLQYPSPQISSSVNPWAPATPSTLPPPSPPHYSVAVRMQQPEALILLCQVQEPLEHISWLWYPCPNRHSSGDGTLIADGTAVFNASLYGIRIIGENGVFISELQILQNPLQTGIAGLYRCEAWLHGANKDSTKHQTSSAYHDEFIIGGNLMVESCFYDPHRHKYYYEHYEPTTHSHKLQKSYRTPRNKAVSDGTTHKIYGDSKVNKT